MVLVRDVLPLTLFIGSKTCHLKSLVSLSSFPCYLFPVLNFIDKTMLVIEKLFYFKNFSGYCCSIVKIFIYFFFKNQILSLRIKKINAVIALIHKFCYNLGSLF